ncbi:flavin-nucleotide-binding protein [Phyllobacterium sp. 628]|nr:flavin-nucleotide-binding protein [Phyllobacterium sp. 628]
MAEIGKKVIRTELIEQHREFYPLLPMVVLGAVDPAGDVWATVRAGRPGFLTAPTPYALHVDLPRDLSDPADAGMDGGAALALLGIDLRTRRRNRLNGHITRTSDTEFELGVEQSYGNCPKYIQLRSMDMLDDPRRPYTGTVEEITDLDAAAKSLVTRADTLFVASYVDRPDGARQVDVSHRGGRSGFVRATKDGSLVVPEFTGNRFYNTLGNFLVNPRAGLAFISEGQLLQMTGTAEIIGPDQVGGFAGAELFWKFSPKKIIRREARLPLNLDMTDDSWSPNSLATGIWPENARSASGL